MTAQDNDIKEFTDADYNTLRTDIYLPNIESIVEVKFDFLLIFKLFRDIFHRIMPMHSYVILIPKI